MFPIQNSRDAPYKSTIIHTSAVRMERNLFFEADTLVQELAHRTTFSPVPVKRSICHIRLSCNYGSSATIQDCSKQR